MQWYENEVKWLETSLAARPKPEGSSKGPLVFYGSSSIRLWNTLGADFPNEDAVNVGFGGSTLLACAYFFERLVDPLHPRAMVFYAGDNDLGDGRSVKQVLDAYKELMWKVGRDLGPLPFAFIGIKPSIARWNIIDRIRAVNSAVKADLAARPDSYFVEIEGAMMGPDGRPNAALFEPDGLHLSPEGYRVWTACVRAQAAPLL